MAHVEVAGRISVKGPERKDKKAMRKPSDGGSSYRCKEPVRVCQWAENWYVMGIRWIMDLREPC